jgi:hypothetical protein
MPPTSPSGVNISVTWAKIWVLVVTVVGGIATVMGVLVSLVYGGLKDKIEETSNNVTTLSNSYRDAVTSGIKVQDLITRAPTLEKTINETHDAVIKVQGGVELLNQKVDANQQQTKIQLDNIQKQVHERK